MIFGRNNQDSRTERAYMFQFHIGLLVITL